MPTAVVAIGGNSLIPDPAHKTVEDQYIAAGITTRHIAALIEGGWDIVIVHGNGPQVGFIMRRGELGAGELHQIPLEVAVADTQGAIGYTLQQNLQNDLRRLDLSRRVVTIVTQVEVSPDDPAFDEPTKPIGSWFDEELAEERRNQGWQVMEDAGRGWRRVVASPLPLRIVEQETIKALLDSGAVVIGVGGGGIPVVADDDGDLRGIAAVIDKDRAAALLARDIHADLFLISTGVEKVSLHYGTPQRRDIDVMKMDEAQGWLDEGVHFAAGSMAPKIEAGISYLADGGKRVVITDPPHLADAVRGDTGTWIVP